MPDPAALDHAHAHVADTVETAIGELARMVAVDTSFPPGAGYAAFTELLTGLVAPLGFECRRVAVPQALWTVPGGPAHGERVNLVASRPGGRPPLGLYFHTDTVPAAEGWRRDPFCLAREGDRLIGLGTADMKGSIAAVLAALRAARACGVDLAYDPVLLLCTDEEGGLYPGVRYLAEQGLVPAQVLNFNGGAAPRVWAGCFGLFNLLVRVTGRGAHAGDPGGAVNAIEAAVPVLAALTALKPLVARRLSALPPPPHAEGRPLAASLAIAAARGGTSGGQVPAGFEILVNRRYPPEETFAAACAEIEATVRGALPPAAAVSIDLVGHLIPTADPGGPHWPRWQQALSRGFGYGPGAFARWGASTCSDFGWVQQATGRTEVLLGGLGRPGANVHAPDEHTTVSDLVALARSVLAYLAAGFAPDLIPPADRTGALP